MGWWDFGEHSGYGGNDLALYQVTCAFCNAKGNFERVNHVEKKHSVTAKISRRSCRPTPKKTR